jgi:hypothetical protein
VTKLRIKDIERNSMIKAVVRSIPFVALGIGMLCTIAGAEPFSVVDSFKQHLKSVCAFSASIERIQLYRNVERKSTGTMKYDKRYGSVYNWQTPGSYRFYRSDFGAYGVDLKKLQGWKTEFGTPDPEFSRQIDPLYRLMHLLSLSNTRLSYQGNRGDMLIFSTDIGNGKKRCIGFDAITSRCSLIEIVDANGQVCDKTKLYYPSNEPTTPVPESIVVTTLVGSERSVDSVIIRNPEVGAIEKTAFAIPPNITWHKRISAVLPE